PDESLAKHKALELEIEHLLRAVVKRFENCIIKKENEYAKLWNDWYIKCEECKYDKISYDKAYNDMQQKIERLQAQLGDQKGKSKDTPCVSNTLDPLAQKLENEVVELEFQFVKQSILGKPPSSSRPKLYVVTPLPKSTAFPKVGETNALSKPVTSNLAPSSHESSVVNNERVIAPRIFRINPFKASKEDVNSNRNGFSPNNVESTTRTRIPQPRNNPKSDKSWKVYSVICLMNYSNGENQVVSKTSAVTTADASDKRQQQQDSTSSSSTLATTITADGNFDL
ncbi:hypothetical protein Tco_0828678, partial [Tanacetum coccineum]